MGFGLVVFESSEDRAGQRRVDPLEELEVDDTEAIALGGESIAAGFR